MPCGHEAGYAKVASMPDDVVDANLSVRLLVNAVLGAMAVTGGLWFLQGGLSLGATVVVVVGLMVAFAKTCPGVAHVWMWSTLLLGLESLAWAVSDVRRTSTIRSRAASRRDEQGLYSGLVRGIFRNILADLCLRTIPPHPTRTRGTCCPLNAEPSQSQAKKAAVTAIPLTTVPITVQ